MEYRDLGFFGVLLMTPPAVLRDVRTRTTEGPARALFPRLFFTAYLSSFHILFQEETAQRMAESDLFLKEMCLAVEQRRKGILYRPITR